MQLKDNTGKTMKNRFKTDPALLILILFDITLELFKPVFISFDIILEQFKPVSGSFLPA